MKKIIAIAMLLSFAKQIQAQTFAEWFKQNKTQKKYLLQQIAALQVYGDFLSKGYGIAKSGLNTISVVKHGDFDLHNDYFNSLLTINESVKRYAKIEQIILLQSSIVKEARSVLSYCEKSKQLSTAEQTYLQHVFENLLNECSRSLADLYDILSAGVFSMKDNERLAAIDTIYEEFKENYIFSRSFGNASKIICMQRQHEYFEVNNSKKINDIK